MKNIFTRHLNSVNETYFRHLFFALKSGLTLIIAGFACIIHGFLPFMLENSGSTAVYNLAEKFSKRCLKPKVSKQIVAYKKLEEISNINQ
jgi:hypothetical protein